MNVEQRQEEVEKQRELLRTRKVLKRLERRASLSRIAKRMAAEISTANTDLIGEEDTDIGADQCLVPGGTVVFACTPGKFDCSTNAGVFDCIGTEDFVCPTVEGVEFGCETKEDFGCPASITYNSDCTGEGQSFYECATDYDCGGGADEFVCMVFGCSGAKSGATDTTYDCVGYDFFCSDDYLCDGAGIGSSGGDFECSSKHIFDCTDDFQCKDTFTCEAGNQCKGEYECGEEIHQYGRDTNGDGIIDDRDDITPGDFQCGTPKTDENGKSVDSNDKFDCLDEFGCQAKDEFDCMDSDTKFSCGTGQGTDKFDCLVDRFFCNAKDGEFDCSPRDNFGCEEKEVGGTFDCPGFLFSWPPPDS